MKFEGGGVNKGGEWPLNTTGEVERDLLAAWFVKSC